MNGALAGDIIGSPYRVLDTADPSFTMLDTVTGIVGSGSREAVRTFSPSATGVSLAALAAMRWLMGPDRGDPGAFRDELTAMHARYPDVPVSRDMRRWLETGGTRMTDDGPERVLIEDSPVHLVGAALCGMAATSREDALEYASVLAGVTGEDKRNARAAALAAWALSNSGGETIADDLKGLGIDLSYGTKHSDLRDLLVYDTRRKVSLDLLGDYSEISDQRTYLALAKAELRGRRELQTVTVPYVAHRRAYPEDIVKAAVATVMGPGDWEAHVREAVTLGGDSSLVASLAGVLSEAVGGAVPDHISSRTSDYLDPFQRSISDRFTAMVHREDTIRLVSVGSKVMYSDARGQARREFILRDHPGVEFLSREDLLARYADLRGGRPQVSEGKIPGGATVLSASGMPLYSDAATAGDVRYVLENFGTGVQFVSADELRERGDALRHGDVPQKVTRQPFMNSFDVVSVDDVPRWCDASRESSRELMRSMYPSVEFVTTQELDRRFTSLESEIAAMRVHVSMKEERYVPAPKAEDIRSQEPGRTDDSAKVESPQRDRRDDDRILILKVGASVPYASAATQTQREAITARYGRDVRFVTPSELKERYRSLDSEHRRGKGARLAGAPVQVRALFLERSGLRGVSNTYMIDTDIRDRERARADLMKLKAAALEVVRAQDEYVGNTTGRRLITETAYRVEVYDDSVVGYRGEADRDEIGISPSTGLLYRSTADEFHAGEYSSSDKMIARMFDGCELYSHASGHTRISVERAEASMRHLCLDEGERDNLLEERDPKTGYRIDSSPYWGEQTRVYMTNLERLDDDLARSTDPELLSALGIGRSGGRGI